MIRRVPSFGHCVTYFPCSGGRHPIPFPNGGRYPIPFPTGGRYPIPSPTGGRYPIPFPTSGRYPIPSLTGGRYPAPSPAGRKLIHFATGGRQPILRVKQNVVFYQVCGDGNLGKLRNQNSAAMPFSRHMPYSIDLLLETQNGCDFPGALSRVILLSKAISCSRPCATTVVR